MWGTGPWVRGMGTWHHPFFTRPPIYFSKNGLGPVHGTSPLVYSKSLKMIWQQTYRGSRFSVGWTPSLFIYDIPTL